MAEIAFLTTFVLLSIAMQLYSNHCVNKRVNSNHKMNKQIKGDK